MISNSETKVVYVGDGITTVFPFSFQYDDSDDLKVALYKEETDEETVLTKDYFIDTTANTVSYPGYAPGEEPAETERPAVLDNTMKLVIYRETPATQTKDLGNKYPLPLIEAMNDKLTMICQEFAEKLSRCVTTSISSEKKPQELLADIASAVATAVSAASDATASKNEAAASEAASADSESNALKSKEKAEEILADIEAAASTVGGIATVYNASRTYQKADQVMLENGDVYRCISPSTGEYPATSGKWVMTATATKDTFERDMNDDLMPCQYAQADDLWYIDANDDIYPANII